MEEISHGGAVLLFRNDKTLLMQHRDNNPEIKYADYWGYPGGHVEKGEGYMDAAIRELTEETDYIPEKVFFLLEEKYKGYNDEEICRHVFWSMYDGIQKIGCNEGQEMKFMTLEEISKLKLVTGNFEIIEKGFKVAFPD